MSSSIDPAYADAANSPGATGPWDSYSFTSLAGSGSAVGSGCIVGGWTVFGSNSAAYNVWLYDGSDLSGRLVAVLSGNASAVNQFVAPSPGIWCPRGLYVRLLAGTPSGAIYVRYIY